jgi:hypothetical protein
MGQAKKRGTAAQRQAEAIEAGRVKLDIQETYHSMPPFRIEGHEPTLQQKLMDRIRSDFPASEKFHILSPGADRKPEDFNESTSSQ